MFCSVITLRTKGAINRGVLLPRTFSCYNWEGGVSARKLEQGAFMRTEGVSLYFQIFCLEKKHVLPLKCKIQKIIYGTHTIKHKWVISSAQIFRVIL